MTSGTICPQEACQGRMAGVGEGYLECTVCGVTADATPPPLQPGEAVWVRAVVQDIGYDHSMECVTADVILAGMKTANRVMASAIRRIEGEVKP